MSLPQDTPIDINTNDTTNNTSNNNPNSNINDPDTTNSNSNQGQNGNQNQEEQNQNDTENQSQNSTQNNNVSQDECTNQFPLPPSSLPQGNAPNVDETHVGINLEFTPVVDIVINKPKLRLANFANGNFSTKCYRA
jgi:hypothetical protein